MRTPLRYYRVSGPVIAVWALGVFALLLAVAIAGALPIGERLAMFLPL